MKNLNFGLYVWGTVIKEDEVVIYEPRDNDVSSFTLGKLDTKCRIGIHHDNLLDLSNGLTVIDDKGKYTLKPNFQSGLCLLLLEIDKQFQNHDIRLYSSYGVTINIGRISTRKREARLVFDNHEFFRALKEEEISGIIKKIKEIIKMTPQPAK